MESTDAQDARISKMSPVVRRFIRYVQINTQSDAGSDAVPSTERQKVLGGLLVEELRASGVPDAAMDEHGYVFATLPSVASSSKTCLGLLAHLDTSSDEPGAVRPLIHFDYDGTRIRLPGGEGLVLDPAGRPELLEHVGEDLITSDGSSLLGSDDKAGVAVLMQLAEDLVRDVTTPRPRVRLCFTVDEEIGRGVDHLSLDHFGADAAYTLDGGGLDTIYAETFNAADAQIQVRGVMVHPGYAKGIMVNAARILSQFIAALPVDEAPETTDGRAGYFHPHQIDASNPAYASARLILRDFDAEGLERRKDVLRDLVEALRRSHPRANIQLELRDQYRNMRRYIDEKDPRVLSFAHEAASQMGISLDECLVRGGTDGARLSEMGVPTPNIFNGGHDFHSRFEWNTAQGIERSLDFVKHLVRYWGIHS